MKNSAALYEIKIRLTAPWLGHQKTRSNVRRFHRGKDGGLAVDLSQWNWTFKQASQALHMDGVDTDTIRPEVNITLPSLVLYRRSYTHNNKKMEEMFEAMRENTVITFNVLVTDGTQVKNVKDIVKPIGKEELEKILAFTGKFLGLSPWGGNYGYGRFDIVSVTQL